MVSSLRSGVGAKHPIERVILIPGGGGVFDVRIDGDLIFSKHQEHRHAEHGEILESVKKRLRAAE